MNPRLEPTVAELHAAVQNDQLVPQEYYYATVGGKSAFRRFQAMGLKVWLFNGRRCVRPSELKAFQEQHATPAALAVAGEDDGA
jgi:hypothetical protein